MNEHILHVHSLEMNRNYFNYEPYIIEKKAAFKYDCLWSIDLDFKSLAG